MRDRSPIGRRRRSPRRSDRNARPATGRTKRTPVRWLSILINTTFVLGVGALTFHSPHVRTDAVAVHYRMACGPIGPVAEKYVDKDEVCRRARKEALRSLKTGRDPDWDAIIRDSMRGQPGRPRRHEPPKRLRHQVTKHQTSPPSPEASPATRSSGPTDTAETEPLPTAPSAVAPPKPSGQVPAPTPTSRSAPSHCPPWRASAVALLALLVIAAYLGRRRRTALLATRSLLGHMKRGSHPETGTTSPIAGGCISPDEARITSLLTKGGSLTGPQAEDAARHLTMEILNRRHHHRADLVLSRPDAWRLFGMDIGILQEDRIPGLILTDDSEHTRALLARHCPGRRILITYADKAQEPREIPHQSQPTIISLKPRLDAGTTPAFDSTAASTTRPSLAGRPPLLSRSDAFNELMGMPSIARHPSPL